jgi:hypothetical protein
MFRLLLLVICVSLLASLVPASPAVDGPRKVIERALEAQGGVALLKRSWQARQTREKGILFLPRPDGAILKLPFTTEQRFDESGREWGRARINSPELKFDMTMAFNGKKGWLKANDVLKERTQHQSDSIRVNTYRVRVERLISLLDDPAFIFKATGEERINGRPALGVRVSRKGRPDVLLYFDKATHLLVKSSGIYKEPDLGGKELQREIYFLDYREVDLGAPDERILKKAKIGTASTALLDFVRQRTPAAAAFKRAKELVGKLGNDDYEVRQQATAALVRLGVAAVPALEAASQNADLEVTRRAALCLARIKPKQQEEQLLAAVRLLGLRRPAGSCERLLALLPAASKQVAHEVRGALYHLAQQEGAEARVLVAALKDKDMTRRAAAEAALRKDGGAYSRQPGRRLYLREPKLPMKRVEYLDGKQIGEKEILDIQFFNRFDDNAFVIP